MALADMQNATVVQGKVIGNPSDMGQPPHGEQMPVAMDDGPSVVQMSCKSTQLPPDIRLGFVKKVYGILGVMLLVTFGLAQFFVFQKEATLEPCMRYCRRAPESLQSESQLAC